MSSVRPQPGPASGARLAPLAVVTGLAAALTPNLLHGSGPDGTAGELTFVVVLGVATAAPFLLFARIQRQWGRRAAWATYGGLASFVLAAVVAVERDGSSTAGLAYLFLPVYLFGLLALAKAARDVVRAVVGRRDGPEGQPRGAAPGRE